MKWSALPSPFSIPPTSSLLFSFLSFNFGAHARSPPPPSIELHLWLLGNIKGNCLPDKDCCVGISRLVSHKQMKQEEYKCMRIFSKVHATASGYCIDIVPPCTVDLFDYLLRLVTHSTGDVIALFGYYISLLIWVVIT